MRRAARNVVALVTVLLLVLIAACAPTPTLKPEFSLTVTQPTDESIINADKVEVIGIITPGAVVSINGELAEVDEEGNFTMMVILEEGPNIIEVIASDLEGNEESRTLVIMYVPSAEAPPQVSEAGFSLTVTEPTDESIINTDKVEVIGTTIPGAVVSINGELVEVDEEGKFTMMVVLEEGPNTIEVIASDLEGNEESRTLVIIYVPSSEAPPQVPETGFFLTVTEPADASIITTDKAEVIGITTPGAVVSVNGELAEVDEEGNFTMMVVLEEGPNTIEVIASDLEGNEESRILAIIYVP